MKEGISARGGARIGWLNATWPSAHLKVHRNKLILNVFLFGRYQFLPEDVVSLKKYGLIPLLGQGVRIHHSVREYPSRIVFWCLGSPVRLIGRIRETGFIPSGRLPVEESRSGSPVRWQAFLLVVVLWNVLFLMGENFRGDRGPGPGVLLGLLMLTLVTTGIKHYGPLQKIFMKEGRDAREIGAWLNFLPFLSGTMLVIMLVQYFSGTG